MGEWKMAEKTAKELAQELLNPRKNGFFKVTDEEICLADQFNEGYKAFLDAAKTEQGKQSQSREHPVIFPNPDTAHEKQQESDESDGTLDLLQMGKIKQDLHDRTVSEPISPVRIKIHFRLVVRDQNIEITNGGNARFIRGRISITGVQCGFERRR